MQGNVNKTPYSGVASVYLIFIFASIVIANISAFEILAKRWIKFDENLGHALPMLALTGYFLFKASSKLTLRNSIPKHTWIILPALILLHGYAMSAEIEVAQQLILWLTLYIYYLVFFTTDSIKPSLFPLGLFIFVIPAWDQLVPYLAGITAVVVEVALQYSNILAYIEGRHIQLPYGMITVADSCSGVRYLTIGFALSYISAFTIELNFLQRMKVILLGIAISIFANWLRVYIIVLIGYHTEMQSELVADHELFGFILFFVLISPIMLYKFEKTKGPDNTGDYVFNKLTAFFADSKIQSNTYTKFAIVLISTILFATQSLIF